MPDETPRPCECEQFNPECRRAGVPMVPLLWQRCRGVGCSPETSTRYRARWDGLPVPPASQADRGPAPGESLECAHRGADTGRVVECQRCPSKPRLKIFRCEVHGECTIALPGPGVPACCNGCKDRETPAQRRKRGRKVKWAYGVTTVSARRLTLLPRTLASLRAAGFDEPHLFVDGDNDSKSWANEFGLDVSCHFPRVKVYGNWVLSLQELFVRQPEAERYLLFQDDLVTYPDLRDYLDACALGDKEYWNLYTVPANQALAPEREGWYTSNQMGKGALALAFNRETVITLLSSRQFVERPVDPRRGWRNVDGGVIHTLKAQGWKELVHNPSLVQHTGMTSSMDKRRSSDGASELYIQHQWSEADLATSFRGENYSALGFTACAPPVTLPNP